MQRTATSLFLFFLFLGNLNAQCVPQLLNCNPLTDYFCDLSANDTKLWNDLNWSDPINELHNLAEIGVDLKISIKDTCPIGNLNVRCLLFLDLDQDGIRETVVNSDSTYEAGKVPFGNVTGAGILRPFDQRFLAANKRWQFILDNSQSGDTSTFRLRWNTALEPDTFAIPELPHGQHLVRWEVLDGNTLLTSCDFPFIVKDCLPPNIFCINNTSVNILPNHQRQLWVGDYLLAANDNVTPGNLIKKGIRKVGTGSGFPVDAMGFPVISVIVDCSELGLQEFELWGIDKAGNANSCNFFVTITDNFGYCDIMGANIEACTSIPCHNSGFALDGMAYTISYVENGDSVEQNIADNCDFIGLSMPPLNTDVTVTPVGTFLNNSYVNTSDMVIMERHISGQDPFNSPYQWFAADANRDGLVNQADMDACRDIILGVNLFDTWRFVDTNYVFPWPGNPLINPIPEFLTVQATNSNPIQLAFYAIPICNVSCGNLVGFFDLEPKQQHLIGTVQPNPTQEGAVLPVQLISSAAVFLELMDASGRQTFEQALELPAGDILVEIPASAMPAAGLYFWQIRVGDVLKTGKLVRQ